MTLRACCIRTTLALSVVFLARGVCADGIGDSCLAESVEAPGCDGDCMEEEAVGADVVLLQNGLHLGGGVGHAIRKSADDEAITEKVHTSAIVPSSVEAVTYEMEEYNIWNDTSWSEDMGMPSL